jgi:hypothetical protein
MSDRARYYTVVTDDNVAHPHVTDSRFITFPNGDAGLEFKNPYGDDYKVNLDRQSIKQVNTGKFNLSGATHAYHSGQPAEDASPPTQVADWSDGSERFD